MNGGVSSNLLGAALWIVLDTVGGELESVCE